MTGKKPRQNAASFCLIAAILFAGFLPQSLFAQGYQPRCTPNGIGLDSFCAAGQVQLHFVDWDGDGPAIILLAGLGDSARIFDDFAPLLSSNHHVVAVTRRGYGLSASPADSDYSNTALVNDLLSLMDALQIPAATFIGHSIAGGELASLGKTYPDRVDRLVYIDAAYDRSPVPELMADMPLMPPAEQEIRSNFERLVARRQATLGVNSAAVASNLSQVLEQVDGIWIPATAGATNLQTLKGDIAAKADWSEIARPSLAFYSSKDVAEQVPPDASNEQRQAMLAFMSKVIRPWMLREQADFIEQTDCGAAVEVPRSSHYLFLEHPQWMADSVLSFLAETKPCSWRADRLPAAVVTAQ